MPKILIFYSKTGGGHYRVAQTLAEQLGKLGGGYEVALRDGLKRTSLGFTTDPSATYALLSTTLLPFYDLSYRLSNTRAGIAVLRAIVRLVWGASFRRLVEAERPDVIVSTHHFISPSTVGEASRRTPFITVVTDIGIPHGIWFDGRAHAIVVPHPEMMAYAQRVDGRRMESAPILSFGFPVDEKFVNVAPEPFPTKRLLLLGGGSGAGQLEQQVAVLARCFPGHSISAICGWNEGLRRRLVQLPYRNVEALGFVDNLEEHLARCDVVISKPGPSSILEAATVGKPLIITQWVGLQERSNVDFVLDHGLGTYCPRLEELAEQVRQVYQRRQSFTRPRRSLPSDGARRIASFVAGLADGLPVAEQVQGLRMHG